MAALCLGGCASFSADGGLGAVSALTQPRIGHGLLAQRSAADQQQAATRTAALLAAPLTADGAVELALLNHPGLQASLAGLGIAEADRVQAGRLRNPVLSFGRLGANGAGVEIDRAITFDLLGLLTLPLAREIEQGRFEQAQLQLAMEAIAQAGEARQAYYGAVAAEQLRHYAEQVQDAADASAELARRMRAAGNFSKLPQLREQAFLADAVAQRSRAAQQAVAARERLQRALGLPATLGPVTLPERLPDLPTPLLDAQQAEQSAIDQRLDVQLARQQTAVLAQALGLTRSTRVVNVLGAGYQNRSATGEPLARGYTVELSLPLFDGGGARLARAEASYQQAVQQTAAVALAAQSEVREAWSAYRSQHALALHYRDTVVPLARDTSEETLLRYNGMLSSVFELLADARAQIASVSAAIEAQREFWLAETRLQLAMSGQSPGRSAAAQPATGAARTAAPADAAAH
jgi:outer membrane protein TolC